MASIYGSSNFKLEIQVLPLSNMLHLGLFFLFPPRQFLSEFSSFCENKRGPSRFFIQEKAFPKVSIL
jgi:hypothetical protein